MKKNDKKDLSKQLNDNGLPVNRDDRFPHDVFGRFFDDDFWTEPLALFRAPQRAQLFGSQFPRVDVSETEKEVKVVADIPGVDPDEVDIQVEGKRIKISGRMEREERSDETPYRFERSYGEFQRMFTLPSHVKEEDVKAVTKDGVLTITLPKSEKKLENKIKIEKK
jgi:HSP20 family protein